MLSERFRTKVVFSGLAYLFAFIAPVAAQVVDQPAVSAEVMRTLAGGQDRTDVIVSLVPSPEASADNQATAGQRLWARQAAVAQQLDAVTTMLDAGEFRLRHRYQNLASFSGTMTRAGLAKLNHDPRIASIEPVRMLQAHLRQGVPLMNAAVYRSQYNGAGMAIAICDTGIDYNHPRLGGGGFPNSKVIGGYDFGDGDADPLDCDGHGSACAGIAAGDAGEVGDYIGGVAYNARLYALKVAADCSGSAMSDAMMAAWDWCITHQNDDPSHPILVISTSFGGDRAMAACDNMEPTMTAAANLAAAAGITVLVSSGNDGYCDAIAWPACISGVISIGAVYDGSFGEVLPCVSALSCATKHAALECPTGYYADDVSAADRVPAYSNAASFLALLAPGDQAYTADVSGAGGSSMDDYEGGFGGTSAACPYAAGAVACLQQAAKEKQGGYLSAAQVRSALTLTGNPVADDKAGVTTPRINLGLAIDSLGGTSSCSGNSPPAVEAGPDQAVNWPSSQVTLDATVTDDGCPSPPAKVTTTWTKLSGPGTVTFGHSSSVDTTATFGKQGTYVLKLQAGDGALTASDTVTVIVGQPALIVSPTALSLSLTASDQTLAPQVISIRNAGTGILTYAVRSTHMSWITSIQPAGGTCTGETDDVTITFDPSALANGTYLATVVVSSSNASPFEVLVPVQLTVNYPSTGSPGDGGEEVLGSKPDTPPADQTSTQSDPDPTALVNAPLCGPFAVGTLLLCALGLWVLRVYAPMN